MDDKRVSAKKKLIAQYKAVFGTVEGKAVLRDLAHGAFLTHTRSARVPGDTEETFMNLGKQDLIKGVFYLLDLDPEEFLKQSSEGEASHV